MKGDNNVLKKLCASTVEHDRDIYFSSLTKQTCKTLWAPTVYVGPVGPLDLLFHFPNLASL